MRWYSNRSRCNTRNRTPTGNGSSVEKTTLQVEIVMETICSVLTCSGLPSCANFDSNNVFTSDDVEGMTTLSSAYATFSATTPTYGGVPLEVCFSLTSTSAIEQVNWLYGDGGSDDVTIESEEDYEICNTYEEKGQFSVNVTILGENEDCGEWEYTDRERAMVVVCEQPAPADGFDGMFTYTGDEGLIYQMINQALTHLYMDVLIVFLGTF